MLSGDGSSWNKEASIFGRRIGYKLAEEAA
jgi:hypothetical protein